MNLGLIILVIVWGSYYISNKLSLRTFSVTFTGIFIRLAVFVIMLIYMYLRKELKSLFKLEYVFPRLVVIGLLGFLLDYTAFMGFKYSTASKGAILLRSDVLFSTLVSIAFGQKVTLLELIIVILMLFGVFLVSEQSINQLSFVYSDIFFLFSALFISLNAFVIRSVQTDKKNPTSDNVIAFYNNFFTFLFFILFLGKNFQLSEFLGIKLDPSFLGLLFASIFQFLIYVFYYHCLRRYPVWLVRSILLLMPVYVSLFSFLFLKEKLTFLQIIGMVIILGCALVLTNILYKDEVKK
ncbi:MAG: DMT family transporter [Fervidobacterium sp.]